jgi:DNA invertase Pin-like site-specific DNA recombinase
MINEIVPKISDAHRERVAVVYRRQPSQDEDRSRRDDLAARAQELGFLRVLTLDDDHEHPDNDLTERPAFVRLVAMVYLGDVGAVLSPEAPRLSSNGQEWSQLIELCGLSGALLIDADRVYDPGLSDDRLLLGLE